MVNRDVALACQCEAPRPSRVDAGIERLRVEIQGAVQGVGFRPFVHRLATELALSGCVAS